MYVLQHNNDDSSHPRPHVAEHMQVHILTWEQRMCYTGLSNPKIASILLYSFKQFFYI